MSDTDAARALSQDDLSRSAEATLDRLLEWITRYEGKSSFLLGMVTGMLGVLATFAPALPAWSPTAVVMGSLAVAPLAASLLCLYFGNYPRTRGPASLIYFASIATMTADEYRRRMTGLTAREYIDDLLSQSHELSRILAVKFRLLAWAYRCLFLALPFWLFTIYLVRNTASGVTSP